MTPFKKNFYSLLALCALTTPSLFAQQPDAASGQYDFWSQQVDADNTVTRVGLGGDPFEQKDQRLDFWIPTFADVPSPKYAAPIFAELDAAMTLGAGGQTADAEAVVYVEQQDYSALTYGASCTGQEFAIGKETFDSGLGTHANSRLRVVASQPIARFKSKVGINSNVPGSVRFAVADRFEEGVEPEYLWVSETIKGGDEAVEIDLTLPKDREVDKRVLYLFAFTTEDGPAHDQANWLEPVIVYEDGTEIELAKAAATPRLDTTRYPFSFEYNGVSSNDFLKNWKFEIVDAPYDAGSRGKGLGKIYRWTDPETKLVVEAKTRYFTEYGAADWVLTFENKGDKNTPKIENVKALDAKLLFGADLTPWVVHTLKGDSCNETSWTPIDRELEMDKEVAFAPVGGRSSNGAFPFWNVMPRKTGEDEFTDGVFFAIGWSGQWNAKFSRAKEKLSHLVAEAGMETFASYLLPGEKVRMPRVLYMPWYGDRIEAQVVFRRMLMENFTPKVGDKPVRLEFVAQCFDRYYRKRAGWEKADAQIASAKALKAIDGTGYWFDAAWFPVGFPNGVGNWYSDTTNFPNGVEEFGDALEEMGLNFVLWFEPERVAPNTEIAEKYPQYVFGGKNGGLYKLNDPEARKWLTDRLLKCIKDFKVDVYRNDFNIDPYPFWTANDEEGRKGITEIRYVEGHYEMWDKLISENPGLWIDNCASGGRRIDLETLMRSIPLWRSDTCCWPGHPEWDQAHTIGLASFLPLFSCTSWSSDEYTFRSASNPGAIMQYDFLDETYDPVRAKASLDEAKTYQKFWYGDFYPLTSAPEGKASTTAWQLHRSDLEAGLIYVFRQPESRYPMVELRPRALDLDAKYVVRERRHYGEGERKIVTGKELYEYAPILKNKAESCVIEYAKMR